MSHNQDSDAVSLNIIGRTNELVLYGGGGSYM